MPSDPPPSPPIRPGSVLRHRRTGAERIVLGRKRGIDAHPAPGWWLTDGSGLADHVLATDWQVISNAQ